MACDMVAGHIRYVFRMNHGDALYVDEAIEILEQFSERLQVDICHALSAVADDLGKPMAELIGAVRDLDARQKGREARGADADIGAEEIAEMFAKLGITVVTADRAAVA